MISLLKLILSKSEPLICIQTWLELDSGQPNLILADPAFRKQGEVYLFIHNSQMGRFCGQPCVDILK